MNNYLGRIFHNLPMKNVLILKFIVGFPVNLSGSSFKKEQRIVKDYLIMLCKVNENWHTYNNSFISYGKTIASEYAKNIQRAYDNLGLDAEVIMKNDIIDSKMPTVLEEYLDSLIAKDGIKLEETILREKETAYLVIYFTDNNYAFISSETLDLIIKLNGIGEIVYFGSMDYGNSIPFYYNFVKTRGVDLSELRFIKTSWEFQGKEIEEKVGGIFVNKGIYYAKYFGNESVDLYLIKEGEEKVPNGNCEELNGSDNVKIFKCKEKSDWFSDFYDFIISSDVGPVTMWWESDGKGRLLNNYIVYDQSSMQFLRGLNKLFRMEKRKNHLNVIRSSYLLGER